MGGVALSYGCLTLLVMPHGNPKQMLNARIDSELFDWLVHYAEESGTTRTRVMEELLFALREGRLIMRPRGPSPFPKEDSPPGSTPTNPIFYARHPAYEPIRTLGEPLLPTKVEE